MSARPAAPVLLLQGCHHDPPAAGHVEGGLGAPAAIAPRAACGRAAPARAAVRDLHLRRETASVQPGRQRMVQDTQPRRVFGWGSRLKVLPQHP